jgi:hypothetical protein
MNFKDADTFSLLNPDGIVGLALGGSPNFLPIFCQIISPLVHQRASTAILDNMGWKLFDYGGVKGGAILKDFKYPIHAGEFKQHTDLVVDGAHIHFGPSGACVF